MFCKSVTHTGRSTKLLTIEFYFQVDSGTITVYLWCSRRNEGKQDKHSRPFYCWLKNEGEKSRAIPHLGCHYQYSSPVNVPRRNKKRLQKPLNSTGSGQVTLVCSCFPHPPKKKRRNRRSLSLLTHFFFPPLPSIFFHWGKIMQCLCACVCAGKCVPVCRVNIQVGNEC